MRKKTYKTQIVLILTVTVIGLMLPGLAQARALRAKEVKGGLSTRAIQRGEGVREDSSKQNLPAVPLREDPTVRTEGAAGLQTEIIPSRTSGVVPLAVYFDHSGPIDYEYEWDFGDGTTEEGFQAAHIYETPGTYQVTLIETNPLTGDTGTASVQVVVEPFSGTTYYVDNVLGDDNNNGLTPQTPWRTADKVGSFLASLRQEQRTNLRFLLKRDQVFTLQGGSWINVGRTPGPIRIGAYYNPDGSDDPTKAKPIIQENESRGFGSPVASIIGGVHWNNDFVFQDLHFRGNYEYVTPPILEDRYPTYGAGTLQSTNIVYLRMEIHNLYQGIMCQGCQNVFIHDSYIHHIQWWASFGNSYGYSLQGSTLEYSTQSHLQYYAATNAVAKDNFFRGSGIGGDTGWLKCGMRFSRSSLLMERFYIADNVITETAGVPLCFGESGGGNQPTLMRDAVIERNVFDARPLSTLAPEHIWWTAASVGLTGLENMLFRNNKIINMRDGLVIRPTLDPSIAPGENIKILNNVFLRYLDTNRGMIKIESNDATIKNNIFYAPNIANNADILVFEGGGVGSLDMSNNIGYFTLAPGSCIDPQGNNNCVDPLFESFDESSPDFLRPALDSPAIDSGTPVTVWEDFEGNLRPLDGNADGVAEYDIGAYEYALLTLPGDFDQDGDVDLDDYAMFEEAYTGANRPVAPGYEYADLDGDGDVDLDDFAIFAANYTG